MVGAGYRVLPLRFMRHKGRVLVTNLAGEHLWMSPSDFAALAEHRLDPDAPVYADLKARHLLDDRGSPLPEHLTAVKYRTRASWMRSFTALHLFVVTLRCNHACPYCQVSRTSEAAGGYDMSPETADRAVDLLFRSPARALTVEFQGGEPALAFGTVQRIVARVEEINRREDRQISFVLASNATLLDDDKLAYMREHRICLSTSLDGPADIHDKNRPLHGRRGSSHEAVSAGIRRAMEVLGRDQVSALMTTTGHSIGHAQRIVDEYVRHDLHALFVRDLSPFGHAIKTGWVDHNDAEGFVTFYKDMLSSIIEVNRAGYPLVEVYAQIVLRRMLTPFATTYMDLQSPYAGILGAIAYNYDGSVYPSDECRMLAETGDDAFRLGSVHDPYESLVAGPVARTLVATSCHDVMPGCSQCALAPWCGADPVVHWATQGDPVGHRPTSRFCRKNTGILLHLLERLEDEDPFVRRLLVSWASAQERGG